MEDKVKGKAILSEFPEKIVIEILEENTQNPKNVNSGRYKKNCNIV